MKIERSSTEILITALWGDAVNRLDTLILELRHLQLNLIRTIRDNALYQALIYEEDYLWGTFGADENEWIDLFKHVDSGNVDDIAYAWVMEFPNENETRSSGFIDAAYCDKTAYQKAKKKVQESFDARNLSGAWGFETLRLYNVLAATQQLKRRVVIDKLLLCYWASSSLDICNTPEEFKGVGRFITARSGVLHRCGDYINRLRDLRAPVERSMDLSTLDDPRPLALRRKGQGLYSEYLGERSRQHHTEISSVLRSTNDLTERTTPPTTHHGWTYSAVSRYAYLKLEDHQRDPCDPYITNHFVNSSFWTAERPDLMPVLGHEISHYYLYNILGDLSEKKLKEGKGSFAALARDITQIFRTYREPGRLDNQGIRHDTEFIRELIVDLMAASTNPHAYLWTLFAEIVGLDLFENLEGIDNDCDLSLVAKAESAARHLHYRTSLGSTDHLWVIRILVLSAWVENIQSTPGNKITNVLVKGVQEVCNHLLKYVSSYSPLRFAGGRGVHFLIELTEALKVAVLASDVTKTVAQIQHKKSTRKPLELEQEAFLLGGPIDIKLRKMLIERFLTTKQERMQRQIGMTEKEALAYEKLIQLRTDEFSLRASGIFETKHDIPWFAFLFRAAESATTRSTRFHHVLRDFNPGQESYALILELLIWTYTYPSGPLSRALRTVNDALNDGKGLPDDTRAALERWKQGEINEVSVAKLIELSVDSNSTVDSRRMDRLKALLRILEDQITNHHAASLRGYLSTSSGVLTTSERREILHHELHRAFNYRTDQGHLFSDNRVLVRLNFSGARKRDGIDPVDISLVPALDLNHNWLKDRTNNVPRECAPSYAATLGRFDGIGIADSYFEHFMDLPNTKCADGKEKELIPFSIRTERIYPFLNFSAAGVTDLKNLCSTITIKLNARDDRLDMCLRLSRVIEAQDTDDPLAELQKHIKPEDQLMITDGDADLILMTFGDPRIRLWDVFEISRLLRDDFMVENCETLQTTRSLVAFTAGKPAGGDFSLLMQLRMHRGPVATGMMSFARNHLNANSLLHDATRNLGRKISWREIPGRLDFALSLNGDETRECVALGMKALTGKPMSLDPDEEIVAGVFQMLLGFQKNAGPGKSSREDSAKFASLVDETITTIGLEMD